jgi:predicted enzyme related to lactoylglutathione lyase
MSRATIGLVLDCDDPEALATFWAAALGLERLGTAGPYVLLASPTSALPKLLLQRVDEPKRVKNRMHLDIETLDIDDEVARLEALGAKRIEDQPRHEHGNCWIVMADPQGNEFCVCDGGAGSR